MLASPRPALPGNGGGGGGSLVSVLQPRKAVILQVPPTWEVSPEGGTGTSWPAAWQGAGMEQEP